MENTVVPIVVQIHLGLHQVQHGRSRARHNLFVHIL